MTEPDDKYSNVVNFSRRKLLKGLGVSGSAILLGSLGCSKRQVTESGCFLTTGGQIRWIVPFPPGGGYDIYSRLLAPFYKRKLGTDIIIENLPGAGGIIAANQLKSSRPDGLTMGILNAPGLLVASLTGETTVPNPVTDFTILGRIARNQVVLVTSNESAFKTIDDVMAESRKRPVLLGISEIGSTNFVNMTVMTSLLGMKVEFIPGFAGSRETSLAVMRGEVDISAFTFESILDRIEAGDLKPLLQISAESISSHPSLEGVPLLGGEQGVARRLAAESGRDGEQADSDARALVTLTRTGLLVAAPLGLDENLFQCLETGLHEALIDREFQAASAKANRSLNVGRAAETIYELKVASEQTKQFIPVIREAINKVRK